MKVVVDGKNVGKEIKYINKLENQNQYYNYFTAYIDDAKFGFEDHFRPTKIDIYNIELEFLSSVKDCSKMFKCCEDIDEFDFSCFDTSEVTNMEEMFFQCFKLKELDLSNFDTRNVTNMTYMFQECSKLTKLNVSSFDTRNVVTMISMFAYSGIKHLDLTSFDFNHCGLMNMIGGTLLKTLKIKKNEQVENELKPFVQLHDGKLISV